MADGQGGPGTDPDTMRSVLGHFPSGVTIVTGMRPDGPAGFTCQSFSSLSLDPPLVLVLPSRGSTSWPGISETGRFCVNVLAAEQGELSTTFARSGTDKFAGVSWTASPSGSPILDGVTAWIDCTLHAVHSGGDVVDLAIASGSAPLIFHRGSYAGTSAL